MTAALTASESSFADQRVQVRRMREALARGGKLEGLDLKGVGGRDGSPSHVNFLTLHSAKGCEYDVVIMVGMEMGTMLWRRETEDELGQLGPSSREYDFCISTKNAVAGKYLITLSLSI